MVEMQGEGILNRAPLIPPTALTAHLLCQLALPSHALPTDILEWEEIVRSQEPGSCPSVHKPSYISSSC